MMLYPASAQEKTAPVTYQSEMLGLGTASLYDTYLSPLPYSGLNISLLTEQIKLTKWGNERIALQHLLSIDGSLTLNPSGTAAFYSGLLNYDFGAFYRFRPAPHFQILAGAQLDVLGGTLYNTRNGNNPINLKLHFNFNASAIAAYRFKIRKQPIQLRYQINLPVAGLFFSPEYGQSYYEIGMGSSPAYLYFGTWANQFNIKNLVSVEVPFNRFSLRFSYVNWFYETRINQLETRMVSNTFYLGFSQYFHTVSSKKINPEKYRYVFE
ncbi:hypothetical protein FACS189463_2610 [Bacteroidia bacterium]|nr:hypothetical protein FACS189463_2610 [Bacteroidia bacterium]